MGSFAVLFCPGRSVASVRLLFLSELVLGRVLGKGPAVMLVFIDTFFGGGFYMHAKEKPVLTITGYQRRHESVLC